MKKTVFLVLTAVLLCLTLIGCGQKDGADYVFDSLETAEKSFVKAVTAPFAAGGDTSVTFSVGDVGALCELFGADLGDVELGAASVGGTVNDEGTEGALALAVELGKKNLTLEAFWNEAAVILASEQLSEAYGFALADVAALLGGDEDADTDADSTDANVTYVDGIAVAVSPKETAESAAKLQQHYFDFFEKLARENFTFGVENVEKNVRITCDLTPENIAAVGSALLAELQEDEEMQALLEKLGGADLVAQILALVVDKEDILASLAETGFAGSVTFDIVKKTSELVGLSVALNADGTPFLLEYGVEENASHAKVVADTVTVELQSALTEDTAHFSLKADEDGAAIMEILFDISDDIELSVTQSGEVYGIYADYTNTETDFTMTMREVKLGAFGLDLKPYGIGVAVSVDAEMPEAPKAYKAIEDCKFSDLQNVLTEFVLNAGLLSLLK